jgi:hypothetical protein
LRWQEEEDDRLFKLDNKYKYHWNVHKSNLEAKKQAGSWKSNNSSTFYP